jgi:hypothetical protein
MVPTRSSVFRASLCEAVLMCLAAAVVAVRPRDADPETFRVGGHVELQNHLENIEEIKIGMPGVVPGSDDAYLCISFQVRPKYFI